MSEQPKERLSALMDDEVSDFELRSLIKQATDNEQLSEQWQRFHLASSVLKQEPLAKGDISSSVMAALADEPAYDSPQQPVVQQKGFASSFIKPLMSMAVAASVTAVVILGGQNFGIGIQDTNTVAQAPLQSKIQPAFNASQGFMRAQYGNSPVISQSQSEADVIRLNQNLNSYINQHKSLLQSQTIDLSPGWMPEGFTKVKSALAPGADMAVFSNGKSSFTLGVERVGNGAVPEGATQVGDMVAVGKRVDGHFVTIVGDLPLMVADRIVNSIEKIQ